MYSFKNDYNYGAHPSILEALVQTNMIQEEGYGLDSHSLNASKHLQRLTGANDNEVYFIPSGTMTNLLTISSMLRVHEACISPSTGHIATHEAGAIEATNHKIITVETVDGKITSELIEPILVKHHFEHMVKPKLIYISNPTELGTHYTKEELTTLYDYCQSKNLLLYCDGARLGSALTCDNADLTLTDMYQLTDAFYIGGTKNGALIGDALIIRNNDLKEEFRYLIKQRGALLSKGRLLGIQFEVLFKDNLYFDLAKKANDLAQKMAKSLDSLGCNFLIPSKTNQIFPIMDMTMINNLLVDYDFYIWKELPENKAAIRLITSWGTPENVVDDFINKYKEQLL